MTLPGFSLNVSCPYACIGHGSCMVVTAPWSALPLRATVVLEFVAATVHAQGTSRVYAIPGT